MPGVGYDEAAEARRRAEEEAERERKRAEIRGKIDQLKKEREPVIRQIHALKSEQIKLQSYQKMWEEKKSKYKGNEVLSEVVLVNVFEGVCADKIKKDITVCVKEMDQTYSKTGGLKENIRIQVLILEDYVDHINRHIMDLRDELARI